MEIVQEYYRLFRELPALSEEIGPDEAAKRLAERTRDRIDRQALVEQVQAIRRRHRLAAEDAQTAFWILQVYYWDTFVRQHPIRGRIMRTLASLMRLKYPKPLLQTSNKVVIESPWGVDCPIVVGFNGDLDKCRPLCEACFAHRVIIEPDQLALLEIAAPSLELILSTFRETPDRVCEYTLATP